MRNTLDCMPGYARQYRGKTMNDCNDAFEVVAMCGDRIAQASSVPDFLFDCDTHLPEGWNREDFCKRIGPRLVLTVIVNLCSIKAGYFSRLLKGHLRPPLGKQMVSIIENGPVHADPDGYFRGKSHKQLRDPTDDPRFRLGTYGETSLMEPNWIRPPPEVESSEDQQPVKKSATKKRTRQEDVDESYEDESDNGGVKLEEDEGSDWAESQVSNKRNKTAAKGSAGRTDRDEVPRKKNNRGWRQREKKRRRKIVEDDSDE